jgi:hypothetical protein
VEADMILTYYAPFAPHSTADYDQYCLANIITHEFGHFIRLLDVDPSPQGHNCDAYADYTMWNDAGLGVHFQEDLACEDEYGAWFTYNDMRWAAPQAQTVQDTNTVNETQLLQNYPDPSNPETWIPYQLAKDANVSINIYDSKGILIRTLNIGEKMKGSYIDKNRAAHWDGTNNFGEKVSSGVYFYKLLADDYTETRRLVILK